MTATVTDTARISLELGCCPDADEQFGQLFLQLTRGDYDLCSVLHLPGSMEEWRGSHRTARKRANRARRLGYWGGRWPREGFEDDVFEINTSSRERQGRPMAPGYHIRPVFTETPYPCPRHGIHTYGVRTDEGGVHGAGRLVAYLWVYRAGELALVSSILGHADHLQNDIMYPLFEAALLCEIPQGGMMVYNRHDSGTDGLRFFKERLGFSEQRVEWLP